jgi:hypothetical protein
MQDDMNDFGEIKAKVSNLQTGHDQLRQEIGSVRGEVANLDAKTSQGFDKILARIDSKFDSVNSTVASRSQSAWTPISIAVGAMLTFGGWAYTGLNGILTKHETKIDTMQSVMVPRVEHERYWREAAEDTRRLEDRVRRIWELEVETGKKQAYLEGQLHPLDVKK